jgi:hypothetical protein
VAIYITNPLSDRRWDDLVACHPRASAFHQRGWIEALTRTYGYEPFVLTTSSPDKPLNDGIVLCRVSSWITGTRLVSLPFSDHCEPLLDNLSESLEFLNWLRAEAGRRRCNYVELRPLYGIDGPACDLRPSQSYYFHELDVRPSLEQIRRGMHKDSIQRRIDRARREGLTCETGRSELVGDFYRLLIITRRRHQLLPQPRAWFTNLVNAMGDKVEIRVARTNGTPIAALLTLRHRTTVVYKYGCSDQKFHHLGGMPLLFWRLIEDSRASGAEKIDFGRSDLDNDGLVVFKNRLGTVSKTLTYYRYQNTGRRPAHSRRNSHRIRQLFSVLPDPVFSAAGRLLYRHMG